MAFVQFRVLHLHAMVANKKYNSYSFVPSHSKFLRSWSIPISEPHELDILTKISFFQTKTFLMFIQYSFFSRMQSNKIPIRNLASFEWNCLVILMKSLVGYFPYQCDIEWQKYFTSPVRDCTTQNNSCRSQKVSLVKLGCNTSMKLR